MKVQTFQIRPQDLRGGPGNVRSGLSLLEVLTALAIFMFSVIVISQMVDSGSRTALRSQRLTKAAILCENVISELEAGIQPLSSTGFAELSDPELGWTFSVEAFAEDWTLTEIDGQSIPGMYSVTVTVVWNGPGERIEFSVARKIIDPALKVPVPQPDTVESSETL